MQIAKVEYYMLIRPLTQPFQEMVTAASRTSPGSRNITHFLEPSQGCANIGCGSRRECYAQDTWNGHVRIPSGNAADLFKRQFESLGSDVGLFWSGYCEPAPDNEEVRRITKAVLQVVVDDARYRPGRGIRFQTQSPMVYADKELLELLIAAQGLMPFYVGVSAPHENASVMFAVAEQLQGQGIEIQLCASPAKPQDPVVYARKIAGLNPASVLYEPQHPTYGKGEMPGRKIAVPSIEEFRQILTSECYKGPVADKAHTFTLLTPSHYLSN